MKKIISHSLVVLFSIAPIYCFSAEEDDAEKEEVIGEGQCKDPVVVFRYCDIPND